MTYLHAFLVACIAFTTHTNLRAQFVEPATVIHTFAGDQAGATFGWVSAPIADLDRDRVPEIAITAPFRANARGRVTVVSGATGKVRFHFDGPTPGGRLGYSVRGAGDVNGDGSSDVLVGAPGSNTVAGRAYVLSGFDGKVLRTLQLGKAGDSFGFAVAAAGDVDRDGTGDLAVTAPNDDTAGANAGRLYVVSGRSGSVLSTFDGVRAGDLLGTGVGCVGDVTGDKRPELVVGARDAGVGRRGEAYVWDVAKPNAILHTLLPDATGVDFGLFFTSSVGDVDRDGWPDVYVGDFADTSRGRDTGKAYVFSGRTGVRIWTIPGPSAGSGFGIGRGAGDVDGDGHADLVLRGWQDSSGAPRGGKAWLYSGKSLRVLRTFTSTIPGATLGFDAHGVGDVDGDGRLDVLITAAEAFSRTGRAYVVASCAGGSKEYGNGLAGSGGLIPRLSLSRCVVLGSNPVLRVADGLGGAPGVALLSTRRASVPFFGGTLLVVPELPLPHVLSGSVGKAGVGAASLPLRIPRDRALRDTSLHVQVGYVDRAARFGISLSAGLTLTIAE